MKNNYEKNDDEMMNKENMHSDWTIKNGSFWDSCLTSVQKSSFTIVSYPFSLLLFTSRTPIT